MNYCLLGPSLKPHTKLLLLLAVLLVCLLGSTSTRAERTKRDDSFLAKAAATAAATTATSWDTAASVPPLLFILDLTLPPEQRWRGAVQLVLEAHGYRKTFGALVDDFTELYSTARDSVANWDETIVDVVRRQFPIAYFEMIGIVDEIAQQANVSRKDGLQLYETDGGSRPIIHVSLPFLCTFFLSYELNHASEMSMRTSVRTSSAAVTKSCTGILVDPASGRRSDQKSNITRRALLHGRNMDYTADTLRYLTLHVTVTNTTGGTERRPCRDSVSINSPSCSLPEYEFVDWTWVGGGGFTTGVRHGQATLEMNTREDNDGSAVVGSGGRRPEMLSGSSAWKLSFLEILRRFNQTGCERWEQCTSGASQRSTPALVLQRMILEGAPSTSSRAEMANVAAALRNSGFLQSSTHPLPAPTTFAAIFEILSTVEVLAPMYIVVSGHGSDGGSCGAVLALSVRTQNSTGVGGDVAEDDHVGYRARAGKTETVTQAVTTSATPFRLLGSFEKCLASNPTHKPPASSKNDEWFLVQTNYDWWVPDPASDPRRTVARRYISEVLGRRNAGTVRGMEHTLSIDPVRNDDTMFSVVMSIEDGICAAAVWRAKL